MVFQCLYGLYDTDYFATREMAILVGLVTPSLFVTMVTKHWQASLVCCCRSATNKETPLKRQCVALYPRLKRN
jgi:hypothetical protein